MPAPPLPIDCVVFGGGAAGLFLLDALRRSGRSALLLEAHELGAGQTVCAQGIIHGGFKYTLRGLLTPAAEAIAEMPGLWRECLAGEREPSLRGVRVRAHSCWLWQTRSLASSIGMLGARAGLRVAPDVVDREDRPPILAATPGTVARVAEQVIDPVSLLETISRPLRGAILRIDARNGLEMRCAGPGIVRVLSLIDPQDGSLLDLAPEAVVLAAGTGNEALRRLAGLDAAAAQRRPLHMAMVRSASSQAPTLPLLDGHCVDGARTRVTITAAEDAQRRVVWQLGGQLAEDGVEQDRAALMARAAEELEAVLPGLDLSGAEWSTYRVDRAERRTSAGRRPDDAQVLREPPGNVITAWPTKLALAPRLAELVLGHLPPPQHEFDGAFVARWPRPVVALPPWEAAADWSAA